MTTYTGHWITTFGPMDLHQDGDHVQGTYTFQDAPGTIEGEIHDGKLVFQYQDLTEQGTGWFEQAAFGQFHGQYSPAGASRALDWNGSREWDGVWDTSFGRMRLFQKEDRVHGFYDGGETARIEGHLDGNRFVFRYVEPHVEGEGWFELAGDARAFHGEWRPDGAPSWGAWTGRRVMPKPGLTWLMVFEAYWQRSLTEGEYSYGVMLKEFFARLPHVAVRHRFFNDETSLQRWLHDLIFVPEPAIVLISSHGQPEGVSVHGKTIDTRRVIDSLRGGADIRLLHFATCLMLKEDSDGALALRIGTDAPFPISGYTASIDWGGSAVSEFSYFDMILSKRLTPEDAAGRLPKLVTYAGEDAPAESPYDPVGFRFIKPGNNKEPREKEKPVLWASVQ